MATRAWYLPTWVNSAIPVTSPTAHTPSATRQRSSIVTAPCSSGSTPIVSSPASRPRGWRPEAMISSSARISEPSSRVTATFGAFPRHPSGLLAEAQVCHLPATRRRGGRSSAGSSRASRRGAPSTIVTCAPKRAMNWASSTPTGPPPTTIALAGISLREVASRFVPVSGLLQAVDGGDRRIRAGGHDDPVGLDDLVARHHAAWAVEAAAAP